LWHQTRGLYIVDGLSSTLNNGDYSPNSGPGPGGSKGDFIYQLEDNNKFSSVGNSQYQFRVYLTNNSDEVLTPTADDLAFGSETPPYWRYKYIPDNSNNFITFGSPGDATPPRNISNGFKSGSTWNSPQSLQPAGPSNSDTLYFPVQTYNSLTITGSNNNAITFVPTNGTPATTISDNTSPADASLNIPFNQLSTYSLKVQYSFDISASYIYPFPTTFNLPSTDPTRPWGEQHNRTAIASTLSMTSKEIVKNSWSTGLTSDFTSGVNNIIYPGFTYYLSNYKMTLVNPQGNTNASSNMYAFPLGTGLGDSDSPSNASVPRVPIVIKPPSRTEVSNDYTSYLTNQALFVDSGFIKQSGDEFKKPTTVYPGNSNSQFLYDVFFFTSGASASASNYNIELNGTRKCVNNKTNSTTGWINGTGETIIGTDLNTFDAGAGGGLSRFILSSVDKGSTVTTSYADAWVSTPPPQVTNTLLELTVSASVDAVKSVSGTEYDRLHGWYMGIDVTQATAVNVNLTNYPDIATRTLGDAYTPYVFTLKQQIDTTTTGSPSNTPVGQTSQYDLYIAEIESDISWNPTTFTPLTIPMTAEFFGLNRPTNSNISTTGFDVSGSLTQVSTRWRPSNKIMNGEVKYYQTAGSSVSLVNANKSFDRNWTVPQIATEDVSEQLQVTKGDLQQSSMNYSRDYSYTPQFKADGTYKNNVTLTPTDQPYTYDFSFSGGNPLWWDYTWGSSTPYNGTSGIHFPSGFINFTGTSGSNIQNLIVGIPSSTTTLPFNDPSNNPTTNFTAYNHTNSITYNQAMWTKDSFKGINASTNVDAYIDYSGNFHNQSQNYTFTANNGDTLSISYTSNSFWYDSTNLPPGGISPASWTNIKWINLRIQNPGSTSTGVKYSIENSSGSNLRLGTDFIMFVKEYQTAAPYGGSYTPNPWGTSRTQTPWLDCMNKGLSASTSGGQNANLGAIGNGIYDITNSTTADKEYAFKTLNATATSNTVQFIRIGILDGKNIKQINLEYI